MAALALGVSVASVAPAGASGLDASRLAVVINEADPLSVRIGEFYASRRGIPAEQVLRVRFETNGNVMRPSEFATIERLLHASTPSSVQAYAVAWTAPYRVGCMSLTTALAAGYDRGWCAKGCAVTRRSAYFDSDVRAPYDELGLRPAMLLAAETLEQARALILRGIAADGTRPRGVAYLLETSDQRRNVRSAAFARIADAPPPGLTVRYLRQDYIQGRENVLFYLTGGKTVPDLQSNSFLPGAIADHLTSGGGKLTGGRQMSSLRWLEAGATASYGTVVEPCNFPAKFPAPDVLIRRYAEGETLIEAYWKSVEMPGQGVFLGEPLARPYPMRSPAAAGVAHPESS